MPGKIIILEGLISSGKSTLGRSLERFLNQQGIKAIFLPEFVNKPLLNLFFANPAKYAFTYQICVLRERFHIHLRAMELKRQGYVVIIDRGLSGDLMFALTQRSNGHINDSEWAVYWATFQDHLSKCFRPDYVVYLNVTPEIAFQRLKERGDPEEIKGYDLEYFINLQAHMEQARDLVPGQNNIKLEWSQAYHTYVDKKIRYVEAAAIHHFVANIAITA